MSRKIKPEPIGHPQETNETPAETLEATTESQRQTQQKTTPASTAAAVGQPNRRTFVPVLTARRAEKDTSAAATVKSEQTNTKQPRRPYVPNLSNRGRGARSANLIQSHSIFEAGPAESTKRYGSGETAESYSKVVGPSGQSHSSTSSIGLKKSIKPESDDYFKTDKSFIDDGDEDQNGKGDVHNKSAYVNIKFETKDNFNEADLEEKRIEKETHIHDLFNKNEQDEKLVLLQIPDNLNLNEMSEGRIGKLRFYRSGKMELCLNGDKYLNVSLSVAGPFLQEAVALELAATNSDQPDLNRMTNLGQIQTKLVCSPVL